MISSHKAFMNFVTYSWQTFVNTANYFYFTGAFWMSCHALLNNIQYRVQIWIHSQGLLPTEKTIKNALFTWQAWNTWTPTTYKAQLQIFSSRSPFWGFLITFLGPAVLNATFSYHKGNEKCSPSNMGWRGFLLHTTSGHHALQVLHFQN